MDILKITDRIKPVAIPVRVFCCGGLFPTDRENLRRTRQISRETGFILINLRFKNPESYDNMIIGYILQEMESPDYARTP